MRLTRTERRSPQWACGSTSCPGTGIRCGYGAGGYRRGVTFWGRLDDTRVRKPVWGSLVGLGNAV